MCMQLCGIRPYQRWNWNGDIILHDTTIPANRKVPGTQISRYDIDIREFVSIGGNSVIRKVLQEIADKWIDHDKLLFFVRGNNGFDFRADRIFDWFSNLYSPHIKFRHSSAVDNLKISVNKESNAS